MGVNDDTLAGEGEEGFEDIVFEVGGRLLEIIQKEGRRSIWMMDKRQSELADAVEPIGMRDPLDIEFLTDVRMRAKCGRGVVELIEDDAVVNAADAGFALGNRVYIKESISFLDQFGQTDGLDAEVVAGAIEIDARLLLVWADLQQDHFFGRAICDDGLFEEIQVARLIEAAEKLAVVVGDGEVPPKEPGVVDLKGVEAGESLHFDQLGFISAVTIFTDSEIKSEEMRVSGLVRDAVIPGDGAICELAEARFEDEVNKVFADVREFGGEIFGDENGRFGDAKFDGAGVLAVQVG